jgi:hypothetical protein
LGVSRHPDYGATTGWRRQPEVLMKSVSGGARQFGGLALVLAAGCGGDAGGPAPGPAAGAYALTALGGAALPVTLVRQVSTSPEPGGPSVTCDVRLVAGALELRADGGFAQADQLRTECDDGRPPASSTRVASGSYAPSGASVRLAFDPPPGAPADYRDTADATLSGAALVVTRREVRAAGVTTIDGTELRYTRPP